MFSVLVLLSGCATTPIPSDRAKPVSIDRLLAFQKLPKKPYGTLLVTRDRGALGQHCKVFIYIDGLHAASVWSGETAKFYVSEGDRIIGINTSSYCSGGLKEYQQQVRVGETHRMRVSIDSSFTINIAPTAF
jgi:hypothetical protein